MKRAIVFINGELKGEEEFYTNYINKEDTVVCADGGAKHVFKLGIKPDLILGDLDSIPPEISDYYQKQGIEFNKHPTNKDKTDTELLLEKLIKEDYNEIVVFAALGGRLDHSLGNLYLLEELYNSKHIIKLVSYHQTVELITNQKSIHNQINKTVSFLPLSQQVKGVWLSGFKYELKNGTFKRGSTLGLSNIIQSNKATVTIKQGKLLMIINN